MIELFDSLKGEFCIQRLQNGKVIDEFKDHNYIMVSARKSVSEIFVGANKRRISRLILGTAGYLGDTYNPITEANGFSRSRECLYSNSTVLKDFGNTVTLKTGEIVKINNAYYQAKEYGVNTYTLNDSTLATKFNVLNSEPYTVEIPIRQYTESVFNGDINYSSKTDCGAFVKYSTAAGNTTVEYTFEIGSSVGNDQFITQSGSNYSLINEAAIFVNNRIFCMKCFPSKLKDDSTTLKIIWKIIF